jgi:hypothetical protein
MAPAAWRVQALERGFVLLGDLKVGVHPYALDLDVGQFPVKIWVRILNLSVGLRSKESSCFFS